MHILMLSTITHPDEFWGAMKQAYSQMPPGAAWKLAVASVDGTRGVNVIVHDSLEPIRGLMEARAGAYGTTEYFEADAANAVGLPGA